MKCMSTITCTRFLKASKLIKAHSILKGRQDEVEHIPFPIFSSVFFLNFFFLNCLGNRQTASPSHLLIKTLPSHLTHLISFPIRYFPITPPASIFTISYGDPLPSLFPDSFALPYWHIRCTYQDVRDH